MEAWPLQKMSSYFIKRVIWVWTSFFSKTIVRCASLNFFNMFCRRCNLMGCCLSATSRLTSDSRGIDGDVVFDVVLESGCMLRPPCSISPSSFFFTRMFTFSWRCLVDGLAGNCPLPHSRLLGLRNSDWCWCCRNFRNICAFLTCLWRCEIWYWSKKDSWMYLDMELWSNRSWELTSGILVLDAFLLDGLCRFRRSCS